LHVLHPGLGTIDVDAMNARPQPRYHLCVCFVLFWDWWIVLSILCLFLFGLSLLPATSYGNCLSVIFNVANIDGVLEKEIVLGLFVFLFRHLNYFDSFFYSLLLYLVDS
jgi:hypothetical protein